MPRIAGGAGFVEVPLEGENPGSAGQAPTREGRRGRLGEQEQDHETGRLLTPAVFPRGDLESGEVVDDEAVRAGGFAVARLPGSGTAFLVRP